MGFLLADDKRYLQGEPYWSQPFLARVKSHTQRCASIARRTFRASVASLRCSSSIGTQGKRLLTTSSSFADVPDGTGIAKTADGNSDGARGTHWDRTAHTVLADLKRMVEEKELPKGSYISRTASHANPASLSRQLTSGANATILLGHIGKGQQAPFEHSKPIRPQSIVRVQIPKKGKPEEGNRDHPCRTKSGTSVAFNKFASKYLSWSTSV
ncbi:hypothetical protein WR25_26908 [Diploscapter pachys]|uniref:Uncharacterized protein n=1 Tax=Diploscapter pachys TaxID=2018661 RepID=A0A2A2JIR2_9BILA|nr:hypothetical protein WR25_26908 [Diploscapter pachys]